MNVTAMEKVSIGEVTLAYERAGAGFPLIQLHGAGFGHHNFAAVTPYLADHFSVINLDQRGFGESDRPTQEYTFEIWADDVVHFMDALGIERAHIHGTSMLGGPVAVTFATRYPDRIAGLVVSCSCVKPDRYARTSYQVMRSLARTFGLGGVELARYVSLCALSRQHLETPEGDESLGLITNILTANNDPEIFDQAWLLVEQMDLRPLLPNVQVPTLVIAAAEDYILTPYRMAGDGGGGLELAQGIRNAELVMIQDSNHSHLLERPAESATAIVGFLRRAELTTRPG